MYPRPVPERRSRNLSSWKIRQDLSGIPARAYASTMLSMSALRVRPPSRLILSGACPGESRGRRMIGTHETIGTGSRIFAGANSGMTWGVFCFLLHVWPDWLSPSGDQVIKHKPCACAWAFSGKSRCDFCSLEADGAAGAVALRLGRNRLRSGALPPAAPDRSFGGTPSWGPIVPGLRYRRRANGSPVLFTRRAHPGIAPVRPDEADSQPAFARPTLA